MTDSLVSQRDGAPTPVLRSAPLFPVALGLLVGVIVDHHIAPPLLFYPPILLLTTVAILARIPRWWIPILIAIASASVGGLLHATTERVVRADDIQRLIHDEPGIVRVRGEVITDPRMHRDESEFAKWGFGGDRTSFVMQVESVVGESEPVPVSGRVQVFVREAVLDLIVGETIELSGWLYPLRPPRNPGAFDWAAYQRRQGVVASMTVNHRIAIQRIGHSADRGLKRFIHALRTSARRWLVDDLSDSADEERSLLEAMVIGHRSQLDRRLNDVFIEAGCIHFLAVSGVHVGIVMLIAGLVCKFVSTMLILLGGTGLRRSTQTWVLLATVVMYMMLTEPRPSILRAGIIAVVYCVARLLGRERARLNWISFTVIVLAVIDPGMVFDVGYQLSTIAVLGVSFLAPALAAGTSALRHPFGGKSLIEESLKDNPQPVRGLDLGWRRFAGRIRQMIFVAIAAWLVTVPIVAYFFGRIHPWGAMNSLLVFPLVMIVMTLGFAKLLVTPLMPTVGTWLTGPLESVDAFLIRCVDRLATLPGASVDVTAPSLWVIVSYYVVLLSFVIAWKTSAKRRSTDVESPKRPNTEAPRRIMRFVPVGLSVVLLITVTAWAYSDRTGGKLVVTVLSVGAGSATVVELPEGQTVLFDTGSLANPNVGRRVVVPFLQSRGIRRIDRVYISHANLDHFNGLPGVMEEIDTGQVIFTAYFKRHSGARSAGRRLLAILKKGGHDVEVLDVDVTKWHYGGATFELLWPLDPKIPNLPANEASIVIRISYEGRSVIIPGDIEDYAQDALLKRFSFSHTGSTPLRDTSNDERSRGLPVRRDFIPHAARNEDTENTTDKGILHADVLVLPHHGGVKSNTQAFIEAVDADVLIRSSHQTMNKTYNGLPNIIGNRQLYNTADQGAIRVEIDKSGVTVTPYLAIDNP